MKLLIGLLILLTWSFVLHAQSDSVLSEEQYLQIVRQFHPVIKLANINIDKSKANQQFAKGAFDPMISNELAGKRFANIDYYNYVNPNVSIPTWYGVDFSAGYENLAGTKYDPTATLGGSSYIGFTVPLLKNLLIDKRRATVQKAKLYNTMANTDKQIVVNDLLQDAVHAYWDWINAYETYKILDNNYNTSKNRFEFIKKSYTFGERPAIDTVESLTQLQSFEILKNESWMYFQNKGLELSNYLWKENNLPYQLPQFIVPNKGWESNIGMKIKPLMLEDLITTALANHPELSIYKSKMSVLGIEKKLAYQDLLPKLDFKYNHLGKNLNAINPSGLLFQNNYQSGLKFEMPLFFNQGRANYKIAKLNIQENQTLLEQKRLNIEVKVKKIFNEYNTYLQQVALQEKLLNNFERMLKAEETLFANGESSMFLINSRELKVLETARKVIDLKTKLYKSYYSLQWGTGILQ
jgi:outer membrane protein TolC